MGPAGGQDQLTLGEQRRTGSVREPAQVLAHAGLAERGDHPAAALRAIAAGRTRYGEIKDQLRAEPARTLDRLLELRLVERVAPVTEPARSRRASYRIADNFLAPYLGVLSRYRTEIERGLGESILPVLLDGLDDHLGPRWEDAFRAHLRRLAAVGTLGPEIVAVGPWWTEDGSTEIDAVALAGRARTPVLVGEAKWARETDAGRLVRHLLPAAARLPGASDDVRVLLCARERLIDVPPGVVSYTAGDIFAGSAGGGP